MFCQFRYMRKGLIYTIMTMTVICATVVQAQEVAAGRDPFHPSAGRSVGAVPSPPSKGDGWGRDPFTNPLAGRGPTQTGAPSPGAVRMLTGIIYSAEVRLAIFGGETYREGSMVGDRKLIAIRIQSVVFKNSAGGEEEVFLEDFTMNK
jgi:hypothetical protein